MNLWETTPESFLRKKLTATLTAGQGAATSWARSREAVNAEFAASRGCVPSESFSGVNLSPIHPGLKLYMITLLSARDIRRAPGGRLTPAWWTPDARLVDA